MTKEYQEYFCPSCYYDTEHEILKEKDSDTLIVKCRECGVIHYAKSDEKPDEISVKAIINFDGQLVTSKFSLFKDEMVLLGSIICQETEAGEIQGYEITSIERNGKTVIKAEAAEISTICANAVDEILLKVIYSDGKRTTPLYITISNQESLIIGEIYTCGKYEFEITHLKLIDGSIINDKGWTTYVRKIKCVYGTKAK